MSGRRSAPSLPLLSRNLHEFNGCAVGIAHVDDALTGIRTGDKCLRFAGCLPARSSNLCEHSIEIFNQERDVHRPNIARSKTSAFAVRRREILEQFDLVTAWRF